MVNIMTSWHLLITRIKEKWIIEIDNSIGLIGRSTEGQSQIILEKTEILQKKQIDEGRVGFT